MNKIDNIDERSDQVREILGKTPNWIIRSGTTSILIVTLLLIVGSALISYDDIVISSISIKTKTPPVYLQAKKTGVLKRLYSSPNQIVKKGDVIAEIGNTANFQDVYFLKRKLDNFRFKNVPLDSMDKIFPQNLELGFLNEPYSSFFSGYQDFIIFHNLEPNKNEIIISTKQLVDQGAILRKQLNQLELLKQDLSLSDKDLERNKNLLNKGVISESEYESVLRMHLTDKQKYENLNASVINTRTSMSKVLGDKKQSQIIDKSLNYQYESELRNRLEVLKNAIYDWEESYILKSPIDGILGMFEVRNRFQNIKMGQVLFTIVPDKNELLVGVVTMPVRNSGKVKVGQNVIIKLDNYPYREWGSLKGNITEISMVPKKDSPEYMVFVNIPTLETSNGKKLDFRQEMQGTAEIITEKLSVLQRIFYNFNDFFTRNS